MRTRNTLLPALLLVSAQLLVPYTGAQADPGVTVAVNARAGLETVSDTAVGANHAIWDTTLGTPEVADLLKGAGVQALRYPGGSYSDIYHWRDHTAPGGYVAPNTDFDHFMAGAQRTGAQPIVTANYGTGTPEEAAEWVRYANIEKNYGVKYWEIGNELYGNGHYGANWEADNHPEKTPAEYATIVRQFAEAMKAVDPTIKVGAVLTTPGDWPDGIVASGDAGTWNQVVLSIAGPVVDFGIVHWYPTGSNGPDSLSKTNRIADFLRLVREQADRYAHKVLPIALTEINTSYGMNTQPGALFVADAYATLLENGVFTVDWWNVHNGPTSFSTIAGQPDYADFGLLSSGRCLAEGTICQPALNTPFAPFHALAMTSKFAGPGDQLVRADASDPLVKVHAARKRDGGLSVLLVNQDPDAAKSVTLDYDGYTPDASAQVLTYTNGANAITTTTGTSATATLPPYSLTTITLRPKTTAALPATPARPAAGAVTDRTATFSWTPTTPGVKYEVHRQVGAKTEQWGETTGSSFTVHNLTPSTRYTVNLIARDNAGRVSWASPPVTFTTATPPSSTCAVTFTGNSDWGNGYIGGIDITNTGTTPVEAWTLAFDWPTTWQQVTSGWNANWTQTDRAVKITNGDQNRVLAPGATTTFGFVGAYQGPNVAPTTFVLNGIHCTTR